MAKPNQRWVVPNSEGGWDIKKPGASRVSGHEETKADAKGRAGEILRNSGGGERVVLNRDGKIGDKDTIAPGNDPFPPRDTER